FAGAPPMGWPPAPALPPIPPEPPLPAPLPDCPDPPAPPPAGVGSAGVPAEAPPAPPPAAELDAMLPEAPATPADPPRDGSCCSGLSLVQPAMQVHNRPSMDTPDLNARICMAITTPS